MDEVDPGRSGGLAKIVLVESYKELNREPLDVDDLRVDPNLANCGCLIF